MERWKALAQAYLETENRNFGGKVDEVGRTCLRARAAMSLLSDAQELADRGSLVKSNDLINAAKVLLADIIESVPQP